MTQGNLGVMRIIRFGEADRVGSQSRAEVIEHADAAHEMGGFIRVFGKIGVIRVAGNLESADTQTHETGSGDAEPRVLLPAEKFHSASDAGSFPEIKTNPIRLVRKAFL